MVFVAVKKGQIVRVDKEKYLNSVEVSILCSFLASSFVDMYPYPFSILVEHFYITFWCKDQGKRVAALEDGFFFLMCTCTDDLSVITILLQCSIFPLDIHLTSRAWITYMKTVVR